MENIDYFTRYLRKCKADGLSKKSIILTTDTINRFIKWCDDKGKKLTDFSGDDIYDFLDYLDSYTYVQKGVVKQYAESTKQYEKSQIKKFLNFVIPDLGNTIIVKQTKNHKHPESILSKEEIQKLIDACQNERDRAIIATFYESGARRGELLSVRIKHVVFDIYGVILTIPQGKTGSRRIRLIFASSFLHQWLDCHPLKNNREAFLFCSLRTPFNLISKTGLFDQIKIIGEKAGIPRDKIFVHNFRHSRATHLSEHLTESQLKEYLGWTKSSTMTSIYNHLSGKDIDKAILKMNNIKIEDSVIDPMTVGRCPRCKEINPETSSYCGKCGLPLKEASMKEIDENKSALNIDTMKMALSDPVILEQLAEMLKKSKTD